jgi:hypothetical protein
MNYLLIVGILIIVIVGGLISGKFSIPPRNPSELIPTLTPIINDDENPFVTSVTPTETQAIATTFPTEIPYPSQTMLKSKSFTYSPQFWSIDFLKRNNINISTAHVGDQFSIPIYGMNKKIINVPAEITKITPEGIYLNLSIDPSLL